MKKLLVILALLTLLIGAGCSNNGSSLDESQTIPVNVKVVELKTLEQYEKFFGKVEASQESQLASRTGGVVKKSYVALGDYVEKGELLIEFDDDDARYSFKQSEQGYQSALYNLEQAKEGRGTAILKAENNLELAEDTYLNAKESYENSLKQFENNIITEAQLKQSNSAYLQAKNNLDIAKDAVNKAYSDANIKALEAQVEQAKIRMDQARSALDDTKIYSPIGGYIVSINANEGEMIPPQAPFIGLIDYGKVTVELSVNQSSISIFQTGKEVNIYIPALEKSLTGSVEYVSPAANKQTLTFPVKIETINSDMDIMPGMFAEVQIDTSDNKNYIRVPSEAVLGTDQDNYVFVYKDGVAEKRDVSVKEMTTEYTYIEKGLSSGELVITKGQHTLTDGTIVELVEEEGNTQ